MLRASPIDRSKCQSRHSDRRFCRAIIELRLTNAVAKWSEKWNFKDLIVEIFITSSTIKQRCLPPLFTIQQFILFIWAFGLILTSLKPFSIVSSYFDALIEMVIPRERLWKRNSSFDSNLDILVPFAFRLIFHRYFRFTLGVNGWRWRLWLMELSSHAFSRSKKSKLAFSDE